MGFMGDFVDRGAWSVEVLLCLYALKLHNPSAVHFNRGNHETEMVNQLHGFANEVQVKYERKLMELFSETFRHLPLAHVLEGQVFVVHCGLPGPQERLWGELYGKDDAEVASMLKRNEQVTLDQIEAVDRVVEPNPLDTPLLSDFLWSDPQAADGYKPSMHSPMVYPFVPDVANNFL